MSRLGREQKAQSNVNAAERQRQQQFQVNELTKHCSDIQEVDGVPVQALAQQVLKDFRGSGIPITMLAEQMAVVVRQKTGMHHDN